MSIIALTGALFQYIEDHIKEPVALEQLSRSSGLSTFQLIRLFDRFTGMTPIAYIRARRLARSLPQLLAGDTDLSVALEWGFGYEQSYIRAFRDTFGVTPARFRRFGTGVHIVEVPNLERFTVSAKGMVGKPKLIVRPAFAFAGELKHYHYLDNMLRGKGLLEGVEACESSTYSAACRNPSPGLFKQQYLMQSGREENSGVEWKFPSGQWAGFDYFGLHPLDQAGATRIRLMMSLVIGSWFTDQGFHWDGNYMETVSMDKCAHDYCELAFCCFIGGL